jgi:NADH:ubiquinone oxidoreductase subunit 3 (subunit A)
MTNILLAPPTAFLIYLAFAGGLHLLGKKMAGSSSENSIKASTYAGGEPAPSEMAAPGYRPFFMVALFFAILHLGVLILGSGGLTIVTGVYLIGLILALLALILG